MSEDSTAISYMQAEFAMRIRRTPERIENDVREFEQLLRGRGWVLRREIERLRADWSDGEGRYLRQLAELSGQIVSGPGMPGYRLADAGTLDEADVDAALLRAHGAIISTMRALAIRARHYRSVHGMRAALRAKMEGRPS